MRQHAKKRQRSEPELPRFERPGKIRSVTVTTYPDNGQTIARVQWDDGPITTAEIDSPLMQALMERAKREKARIRWGDVG